MTKTEGHDRLRQARIAAGFKSSAAAAERFGWKKNTYKSNENGNAPFSFAAAKEFAKAFGVRPEWLYDGRGPIRDETEAPSFRRTVPLVGYVGAGAHFYAQSDGSLGEVDAPENSSPKTVAAEIRGTSLGPLFERWLIFYDNVQSPVSSELYERLCIVGLPDERILVKLIRPAALPGHFHLLSNNEDPILDQVVDWAARVKSMTPR